MLHVHSTHLCILLLHHIYYLSPFFQSFTPRLPFTISQKFYFDMQDTFNPQGLFIAKILDVV